MSKKELRREKGSGVWVPRVIYFCGFFIYIPPKVFFMLIVCVLVDLLLVLLFLSFHLLHSIKAESGVKISTWPHTSKYTNLNDLLATKFLFLKVTVSFWPQYNHYNKKILYTDCSEKKKMIFYWSLDVQVFGTKFQYHVSSWYCIKVLRGPKNQCSKGHWI